MEQKTFDRMLEENEEGGTNIPLSLQKAKRLRAIEVLMQKAKHMRKTFSKLPIETFVASIREDKVTEIKI